jgi:hypothetical protein
LTGNLKDILNRISYIIDKCNNKPSGQIKLKRLYCGNIIKDVLNENKIMKEKIQDAIKNGVLVEFNTLVQLVQVGTQSKWGHEI